MITNTVQPSRFWPLAGLISLCCFTGCVNQRVAWSPDGAHAAVFAGDGLHLCDPDGVLSELVLPGEGIAQWFPDSHRLAVVSEVPNQSWNDLDKILSPEQRKRVVDGAGVLLKQLQAGSNLDDGLKSLTAFGEYEGKAVVAYLAQSDAAKDLGENTREALRHNEAAVVRLQIATVENGKLVLGPTVLHSLRKICDLRVSPTKTAISFTSEGDKEDVLDLMVVPADGSAPPQLVARNTAFCSDWSTDGRSLVYLASAKPGDVARGGPTDDRISLGSLTRRVVLNAAGKIEIQSKAEDLAGLLFESINKVRCLSDGRIVFAAADVHLPCAALDMPQQAQLYVLDPERQTTVIPLIPRGVQEGLPVKPCFYEVSPDGKRIAILGEKGTVAVFTPATGDLQTVQAAAGGEAVSAPAWRSANELCFISSAENQPQQVSLWKEGTARALSTNWPAAVRKGFLDK
jgi:hypothetical protein